MSAYLFLLGHSTEAPERAVTILRHALAAAEAGSTVALWLSGEGVRLGVRGVAETIREPTWPNAADFLARLRSKGGVLHVSAPCFEERGFVASALREEAKVEAPERLVALIAQGLVPVAL